MESVARVCTIYPAYLCRTSNVLAYCSNLRHHYSRANLIVAIASL